ncbi:hypothetical protein AB0L59_01585 [Streptomyces sp. NPDC052109]
MEFVELLLVGDERSRLRDERDGQHRTEHKAAPRATQHLVYASHIVPHAA